MTNREERMEILLSALQAAWKLSGWQMDAQFAVLNSNAANPEPYHQMFLVSSCRGGIEEHCQKNDTPVIAVDTAGIAWIAQALSRNGKIDSYHLLGPFFTVETTEEYLYQICSRINVSSVLIQDLIGRLKEIPSVAVDDAQRCAVILHYGLTGKILEPEQTAFFNEISTSAPKDTFSEISYHGTWEAEQRFFEAVKNGENISTQQVSANFSHGTIGEASDNPIRQLKDELIVKTVLCCRAAMSGGASPDGCYSMSDYYMQKIESLNNISALQDLAEEILQAFLYRSRQAKKHQQYSAPICAVMEYIWDHLTEKISLKEMAAQVNYAEYYLSNKFRKEVGVSINTYIMDCKISLAERMLRSGRYSVCAVSDYVGFSTASYFGTVFKQHTGMTPTEYIAGAGNTRI